MVSDFYFDTSALLKGYVSEPGSSWVQQLMADHINLVFTSALTSVEAACAFARREREGLFSAAEHEKMWRAFEFDIRWKVNTLRITRQTLITAQRFGQTQPLRAYDALQLAAAWLANERLLRGDELPLTFVAADLRLLQVAHALGLNVTNPLEHQYNT